MNVILPEPNLNPPNHLLQNIQIPRQYEVTRLFFSSISIVVNNKWIAASLIGVCSAAVCTLDVVVVISVVALALFFGLKKVIDSLLVRIVCGQMFFSTEVKRDFRFCRYLIQAGADVNQTVAKLIPLSQTNPREFKRQNIGNDTSIDTAQTFELPLIYKLLERRDNKILQLFCNSQADVNCLHPVHKYRLLHHAVSIENHEAVQILLKAGALANMSQILNLAVLNRKLPMIQTLLDAGASPNIIKIERREAPLFETLDPNAFDPNIIKILKEASENLT